MKKDRHTPGPWVADKYGRIYQEHPELKGEPKYHDERIADCLRVEDARLIAAAPDLLANLENILTAMEAGVSARTMLDCAPSPNSYVFSARAAITKATGPEPQPAAFNHLPEVPIRDEQEPEPPKRDMNAPQDDYCRTCAHMAGCNVILRDDEPECWDWAPLR